MFDRLTIPNHPNRYLAISKECGYDPLGKPVCDKEFEFFRQDVGVLEERRWTTLEFESPVDENCPCWFVANAAEPDKTVAVKLVCRTLLALKMELQNSRVASTERLRREWERRLEDNAIAVASLTKTAYWWEYVDGPDVELLWEPTPVLLADAQRCAAALSRMVEEHKPQDGTEELVEEIVRAVGSLKLVSWDAIYSERFSLTPYELFRRMVGNAEMHLTRRDAEAERRCARLAAAADLGDRADEEAVDQGDVEDDSDVAAADEDPGNNYFSVMPEDLHGLDIDREFKFPDGRDANIKKPAGWRRAVNYAGEVLINEMRRSTYLLCVDMSAPGGRSLFFLCVFLCLSYYQEHS